MGLKQLVKDFRATMLTGKIFWTDLYGREYLKQHWNGYIENDTDYSEKYRALVHGLDEKSIDTVVKILKRYKAIVSSDKKRMDIFTDDENIMLYRLKYDFHQAILRVAPDIWAWRDYLLPVSHFEGNVFFYNNGMGEIENSELLKGKVFIDVGAYVGDSALVMRRYEPSKIYCFEPDPTNVRLMEKTFQINQVNDSIPVNKALGNSHSKVRMQGGGVGGYIDLSNKTGNTEVEMITLDEFVEEKAIEVGLIKVDIEGAERFFLEGAKRTICSQKPVLLISIYHTIQDFFELKPMIEEWNIGYRFKIYKPVIENPIAETLLIAECTG